MIKYRYFLIIHFHWKINLLAILHSTSETFKLHDTSTDAREYKKNKKNEKKHASSPLSMTEVMAKSKSTTEGTDMNDIYVCMICSYSTSLNFTKPNIVPERQI